MLRNCVWALSNFFRGKPQPHIDVLRPALPVLAKLLAACQDADCLQVGGQGRKEGAEAGRHPWTCLRASLR